MLRRSVRVGGLLIAGVPGIPWAASAAGVAVAEFLRGGDTRVAARALQTGGMPIGGGLPAGALVGLILGGGLVGASHLVTGTWGLALVGALLGALGFAAAVVVVTVGTDGAHAEVATRGSGWPAHRVLLVPARSGRRMTSSGLTKDIEAPPPPAGRAGDRTAAGCAEPSRSRPRRGRPPLSATGLRRADRHSPLHLPRPDRGSPSSELTGTRIRATAVGLGLPHLAEVLNPVHIQRANEAKMGYLDLLDPVPAGDGDS
ncbi:hypothetical protein ACFSL4_13245 [Streptomyces caeni]|uniref:Uncharacterized protein n=1 Tax=Streptomyces caeni TaxID=2307231 RepID=A0ABW4IP99_9ACTN